MNPLEYLDTLERLEIQKIKDDSKEQYTKDEVIAMIKELSLEHRKAIYKGEYIMDIETVEKRDIKINDTEFSVQTLITHDNKYLLFVQITDALGKDFTDSDMEILAEQISKAVSKSENIAGVMLLQPNVEVSLITAKLDTLSYAKQLDVDFKYYDVWSNGDLNNAINNIYYTTSYTNDPINKSTSSSWSPVKYTRDKFKL